jgi:aminoglycoside phosphotransferase (APT) family kinase protein
MALGDERPTEVAASADSERIITDWIESRIGGRVGRIERQGRWRPAWHVDVVQNGAIRPLYVRGERMEQHRYSLAREYQIHRLLEEGGVRTAHVHGYIDDLPAIVMDRVPGRPDLRTADNDADREAIRVQFVEQMALMHGLDVAPFRALGMHAPDTPRDVTLSFFDGVHPIYRARKTRPDPALEFGLSWVLRHAPPSDRPLSYAVCDAGQFIFEGSRLTAMMDFELSVLGDPFLDLAALRVRSQWEYLGDLPSLYALYGKRTGQQIDLRAISFQTAAFSIGCALGTEVRNDESLANPQPDTDYVEYVSTMVWLLKEGLEAAAEYLGLDLTPFEAPTSREGPFDEPLLALRRSLGAHVATDAVDAYRQGIRQDLVAYLDRVAAYGAQFETDYLRDAAEVLGRQPESTREADALLEAYVRQASPDEDARLLRLIYANVCRKAFLLATPNNRYRTGLLEPILPIR